MVACSKKENRKGTTDFVVKLNRAFQNHQKDRLRANAELRKSRFQSRQAYMKSVKDFVLPMTNSLLRELSGLLPPDNRLKRVLDSFLKALKQFRDGLTAAASIGMKKKPEQRVKALTLELKNRINLFKMELQKLLLKSRTP